MDQRGLVERARGGDHDAFTELARGAVTRLDRAARLILRDPELARDAVHDALIRAWRDFRGLRDPDRFDAWLYRLIPARSKRGAVDDDRLAIRDLARLATHRALTHRPAHLSPTPGARRLGSWRHQIVIGRE